MAQGKFGEEMKPGSLVTEIYARFGVTEIWQQL